MNFPQMMGITWWEFEGKEKKPPKDLVYRVNGSIDKRYKVNKEFITDKRWVFRDPLMEMMAPHIVEYITSPSVLSMMKDKTRIRFKRYGDLPPTSSIGKDKE